MKPDAIERLLAAEETIEPSPDFARRVMAAVELERRRAGPPAVRFPWLSAALTAAAGLAAALALVRRPAVIAWEQRLLDALARAQLSPLELATLASAFALLLLALGLSFWLVRRAS